MGLTEPAFNRCYCRRAMVITSRMIGISSMGLLVCCNKPTQHRLSTYSITPGFFNGTALDIIRNSQHVQSVCEDGIMSISVLQYVVLDQRDCRLIISLGPMHPGDFIVSVTRKNSPRARLLRESHAISLLTALELYAGHYLIPITILPMRAWGSISILLVRRSTFLRPLHDLKLFISRYWRAD